MLMKTAGKSRRLFNRDKIKTCIPIICSETSYIGMDGWRMSSS
jgi:hypothetical protein